eukprot:TRINITY_DN46561_c0_g1_i1.p1 TRINITY_DN46561_c0_g1~~TRINITY_DN46561_c0_g1_i1.p1  ORF type:complete len:106 (+),score=6.12 TRINITY_DN46561_c0_g1_i1:32-349(+)
MLSKEHLPYIYIYKIKNILISLLYDNGPGKYLQVATVGAWCCKHKVVNLSKQGLRRDFGPKLVLNSGQVGSRLDIIWPHFEPLKNMKKPFKKNSSIPWEVKEIGK